MPKPALAEQMWREASERFAKPFPARPTLVVLAGVPLSGKSTLARALAQAATTATLHVENDAVRGALVREPTHAPREHFLTYRASWALTELALRAGANALHDATNLTESGRKGAYQAAEAAGATVAVVLVRASPEVLAARAATLSPDRQRAHARFAARAPQPSKLHPCLALDGARPAGANLAALRAWPPLHALFE